MNVSFTTDFSVQKKGFKISYKQVAVSLRNQKLTLNKKEYVSTATSVTIPNLEQFTVCFEATKSINSKENWTLFSYKDASSTEVLTFGKSESTIALTVLGANCDLSDAVPDIVLFSKDMQLFCLTWDGTTGYIAISTGNNYEDVECPASKYKVIPSNGVFSLGTSHRNHDSFTGDIYNFRLWKSAMSTDVLLALTCDEKGDVIDWKSDFWNIAASYLTTDENLSCGTSLTSSAPVPTASCSSSGLGCPETLTSTTSIVTTTNMIDTNPTVTVRKKQDPVTHSQERPVIYMTKPEVVMTQNMPAVSAKHNVTVTEHVHQEGVFYRISFVVYENQDHTAALAVEQFVSAWLNQTFQNWTYPVYVANVSMLNLQNYTSYWGSADLINCTGDIDSIAVSAENAADVATQLADITDRELTTEEVTKIVTKLNQIISVATINASLASKVVAVFSNVLTSSDTALAASSPLALKTVDDLARKIIFTGPSLSITSKNLALGIAALNSSIFNGTSFNAALQTNASDIQVSFESDQGSALASVILPSTLLNNLSETEIDTVSRIQFTFYSKTGLFQDQKNNGLSLSSYVVASSVGNASISNLQDPVKIQIQHTHYQDISGAAAQIDAKNTKILTLITYIGCGISAIFSAATLLTYIAFEKLRRDYPSKILMNLSTALLFLNMVFLLDGWLATFKIEGLCIAVAVFLHFFLLSSFTWMGLEAVHMYIALVKVFNTYIRRYILKFCIVGWGLPAVTVAVVVAIDRNFYGKQYYGKGENGEGSSEFCWIKDKVVFYVTCVCYFGIVLLMNVAMFIVVMVQICGRNGKRSNRTLREEILRNLRSVISLTFLLGMTWGFAFFAWGPVNLAFMYLFAIFNSLQDWSKTATNNTKKVSSDNLGKSLSSSSIGNSSTNWTSKSKTILNPFAKRNNNTGNVYGDQTSIKSGQSEGDQTSIIPVHQVIDKVKGYCSVRSDNFYKNISMSDSFSHSTKF
ncbi:G-protein coupled receptor 126 [Acipenser ruthenus]|uniref:Adhesion G-protein coupled receptor G6 n=1 Tax=Acipenser ruthenus TaxID=7906 RepID=A0A444TXV6_ACIRT|nr:G-protein coupled receptor 126 [Acipenser ruthenus]